MPRLRPLVAATLACLLVLCHFGCASKNDQTPNLDAQGKHPSNWVVAHRAAYQGAPNQCVECHGADLRGGIAKVDCFNQAGLGTCHAGGHGPRLANHPVPFKDPLLHGPRAKADLTDCQRCHADNTTLAAGINPRFNVQIGSLAAGCEDCHPARAAHPANWLGHPASGRQAVACALCHGAGLAGESSDGPACGLCHASTLVGVPVAGCVSCHAAPPDANPPTGNRRPNRAGSHQAHGALPEATGNCSVCHTGGGTGSSVHYSRVLNAATVFGNATVAVLPAFNAKSGSANYNGATQRCSNVQCHGGQLTPAWGTSLDAASQCGACHEAGTPTSSPQFNSYFSGKHVFHIDQQRLDCRDCHDMTKPAPPNHFSNLSSAAFNQSPASTIRGYVNYQPSQTPPSCSPTNPPAGALPGGTSIGVCHGLRTWTFP